MRAAEAAKNTANLIEGTVTKVKAGSDLVNKTGEAFTMVTASSGKVKELVSEIAAASTEQAQGVDQVNRAVAEMNRVTQQTATNAEESASASEELSAQSDQMRDYVGQLTTIVGGAVQGNGPGRTQTTRNFLQSGLARVRSIKAPEKEKKLLAHHQKAQGVNPKQVIPLEEEDFKDF